MKQLPHHGGLHHRKDLAGVRSHRSKAEDFVAIVADVRFHEATCLRQRSARPYFGDRVAAVLRASIMLDGRLPAP